MLKINKVLFALVLPALLGSACTPSILNKVFSGDTKEEAKHYIDLFINGNYEAIISDMDPKILKGNEMEMLSQMGKLFPQQAPTSIKLVNFRFMRSIKVPATYFLTYEYEFEQKWLLVYLGLRKPSSESPKIVQFGVYQVDRSLEETHKFTLQGIKWIHYFFLIFCVASPLFIFATLIACIRTKLKKRKWLWIIFILVGFVQFSLNWTTGQDWIKFLQFQLLGAGFVRASVYSPWILSFSIPVGAILFWVRRKKIRKDPTPEVQNSIGYEDG